ncbi:MAG: N-acetyl sugar amidotransferase [bacterium]|nr:N-acetyl sugar amidotransferase [bacterium]
MRYCKKCVMPDTRPGIVFDEEGVCCACRVAEKSKNINWNERMKELEKLCDKYRRKDGYYDCIVTVSGGKDSHFQVYVMKELMKMNPLLINVGNVGWRETEAGIHNFNNMSEAFGCDTISFHPNRKLSRKIIRKAFEKLGSPCWYWDRAVYAFPVKIGIDMKIPLIIYGEDISYQYGGFQRKETYSAKDQINNDVAKNVGSLDFWCDEDISIKDLNACVYPAKEEIEKAGLEPIYLSYFVPWDGYKNLELARKYGFKSLDDTGEWKREGYIEDYDQIDSYGYLLHPWLKYPKFGHARTTDVACYWIRTGRLTREEAIKLVKENDHKLDKEVLKDFIDFIGYTEKEFWAVVDKLYNKELFEKVDGKWVLKNPIWKQS